MSRALLVGLALLLAGCDTIGAGALAKLREYDQAYTMLRMEHWTVRRDLRERCYDDVIDPGIERLIAAGKPADAIAVIKANYPGLLGPITLDDLRQALKDGTFDQILKEMPYCTWPKGVELGPLTAS